MGKIVGSWSVGVPHLRVTYAVGGAPWSGMKWQRERGRVRLDLGISYALLTVQAFR